MTDPFRITGPAVISFSGGRTSAYMLWRILQAHGGMLLPDVVVCFANTGREMPATLDFVRDCGAAWSVNIVWIEYRYIREPGSTKGANTFSVVSHNSASRDGEPFAQMLGAKSGLPHPMQRSCTEQLKIFTIQRWQRSIFGKAPVTHVIGLRADGRDARRAEKRISDGENSLFPLYWAGIEKPDVLEFWKRQPFDLRLRGAWEGNCDGCFLKSRAALMRMIRDYPERMAWWPAVEAMPRGASQTPRTFHKAGFRETYAVLTDLVSRTPMLPMDETMHELGEACDGGCGI